MEKLINKFGIAIAMIFAFAGVVYAQSTFLAPTQAPPGGNTEAPLNVGASNQTKNGALGVNSLAVFNNEVVNGSLNVKGGYFANGVPGIAKTCINGQALIDPIVAGGILTGGNCATISGAGAGAAAGVPVQLSAQSSGNGKVTCPAGKKIIGGGCSFQRAVGGATSGTVNACVIAESYPRYSDNSWNCTWHTNTGAACGNSGETHTYAICL